MRVFKLYGVSSNWVEVQGGFVKSPQTNQWDLNTTSIILAINYSKLPMQKIQG
jgi:hypothetical protein